MNGMRGLAFQGLIEHDAHAEEAIARHMTGARRGMRAWLRRRRAEERRLGGGEHELGGEGG